MKKEKKNRSFLRQKVTYQLYIKRERKRERRERERK